MLFFDQIDSAARTRLYQVLRSIHLVVGAGRWVRVEVGADLEWKAVYSVTRLGVSSGGEDVVVLGVSVWAGQPGLILVGEGADGLVVLTVEDVGGAYWQTGEERAEVGKDTAGSAGDVDEDLLRVGFGVVVVEGERSLATNQDWVYIATAGVGGLVEEEATLAGLEVAVVDLGVVVRKNDTVEYTGGWESGVITLSDWGGQSSWHDSGESSEDGGSRLHFGSCRFIDSE